MEQEKENKIPFDRLAFMFGIISFLSLLGFTFYNMAIVNGVAAITSAFYARTEGRIPTVSKVGMALGFVGIFFGVAEFGYLVYLHRLLKDPQWAPFFEAVFNQYARYMQDALK